MGDDLLADERVETVVEVLCALQHVRELAQRLRHGAVDHHVRAGDRVARADHAELKLVSREGKGARAVAVGRVPHKAREDVHAQLHARPLGADVGAVRLDRFQHRRQLVAEEHGDHGRRRLVRAEAVVVARRRDGDAQQILIFVHGLDDRHEEQQKPRVFIRRLAGAEQVLARVGGHGPVVVLAAAVHASKGLFVQQALQPVLSRDLFHHLHRQLVVVGGDVCRREDRRQLMLRGRDLVVLGLREDAELPELLVQILHIGLHARLDRAEIVILQLLPLRGLRAEERPAGVDQILSLEKELPVDEEIFLLGADVRHDAPDALAAEEVQNAHGLAAERLHAAQQRRFLVQRLAAVGAEGRGDAQGIVLDKCIAARVPRGVAPRLKRGAQTARGEGGGVRLAPDKLLAGKLHDHPAVRRRRDKAVVLFGGDAGQRLEPVREMRRAVGHSPVDHGVRDGVGQIGIQLRAARDGPVQRLIDLLRQSRAHDLVVKNLAGEHFRYG